MTRMTAQVICLGISICMLPFLAYAEAGDTPRLIRVTGTATVKVIPDEVVVTVGVETVDKDIAKAQSNNNERVKAVFNVAKQHGLENRYVQTDHVSIDREYEYRGDRHVFVGFEVQQTIAISLRNIGEYETLMTNLLRAGVNRVHSVSFRTTKLRQHKDQARAMAMKAAKEKATALAETLDAKIGRVHSITEIASDWSSSYRQWWRDNRVWSASNTTWEAPGEGDNDDDSIAPGQIRVTASVEVSFDLD